MKRKLANRIFLIAILLGMLTSSAALGGHLDLSSTPSGPPRIHQPKQAQKRITPKRTTPVSLPSSRTNPVPSSLTKPRSIQKGTERKKHPAKHHTTLGWQFLLNGQVQAALSAYRQALRHNPQSARAYLGLGITLKSIGKVNMAKKALMKAVNLDSHLPSALVHLGYLYAEGHFGHADVQTARRLFTEASQLGDPFATIALIEMKSRSKP